MSVSSFLSPVTRLRIAWLNVAIHCLALALTLRVIQFGLIVETTASRSQVITANVAVWQIGWLLRMLASLGLVLLLLTWADVVQPRRLGLVAVALCFASAMIDWVDEVVELGVVLRLADRAASDQTAFFVSQLQEHAYHVVQFGMANALYTGGSIILAVLSIRTPAFPHWLAWLGLPGRSSPTTGAASRGSRIGRRPRCSRSKLDYLCAFMYARRIALIRVW
jgi:hypothetical protein